MSQNPAILNHFCLTDKLLNNIARLVGTCFLLDAKQLHLAANHSENTVCSGNVCEAMHRNAFRAHSLNCRHVVVVCA